MFVGVDIKHKLIPSLIRWMQTSKYYLSHASRVLQNNKNTLNRISFFYFIFFLQKTEL